MSTDRRDARAWVWVGLRLTGTIALLVLASLIFYAVTGPAQAGLVGAFTMLFGFPFTVGAILALLLNPSGEAGRSRVLPLIALLICVQLVVAGVLLREGIICMIMLAPLWVVSGWLGGLMVKQLQAQYRMRAGRGTMILVALPFLAVLGDPGIPNPVDVFEVERSIVIDAKAEEIWPYLLELEHLSDEEGRWTIAQNLLRIPRPRSAVVAGDGIGAVRHARWGDHVSFEEHITGWDEGEGLRWQFVFPNESVARYTDEHIGPDSLYLSIGSGGYRLDALVDGRTRLTLTTDYTARSPVNHYSAIWGEVILGGIQRNILVIIRDRAEGEA